MTLDKFGAGTATEPPEIERKRVRWSPHAEGKIAGFIGRVTNRGEGIIKCYSTRREGQHLYRQKQAWAISTKILDACERIGVAYIFVWDRGTGNVWEYKAHDFYSAKRVPRAHLDEPDDPQRYVRLDDADTVWDGLGEEMFVRPFDKAMDYCLD